MSNPSKKPSGYDYKKRRQAIAQQNAKEPSVVKYFLRKTPSSDNCQRITDQSRILQCETINELSIEVHNESTQEGTQIPCVESIDLQDPASWPQIINDGDLQKLALVEASHHQDFLFPQNKESRKFSSLFFFRTMANGTKINRDWLIYSISTDSIFCICCKLFSMRNRKILLCDNGFNDWRNCSRQIKYHETSCNHIENYKTWKEFVSRLQSAKTIDNYTLRMLKQEEVYWNNVLKRIFSLVKTLSSQSLAFRGTDEHLYKPNNGNFLKLIEYTASFDVVMQEHVRRVQSQDNAMQPSYLGKTIQNEVIEILAKKVHENIAYKIKQARYFSIILDCTPDISHQDQMTVVIRYIDISQREAHVKEQFLGYLKVVSSTGSDLLDVFLNELQNLGLDYKNIRGQGYDNGPNMSGKNIGVQKLLLNINPRAFYVPCGNHTLNLTLNDAVSCCLEAKSFFILVQHIYVFFSASTKRWVILVKYVTHLTLKPLSDTRWESRIEAIKPYFNLRRTHRNFRRYNIDWTDGYCNKSRGTRFSQTNSQLQVSCFTLYLA